MEFLDLRSTYGNSEFKYRSFNLGKEFGLRSLTANAISKFGTLLAVSPKLRHHYLAKKVGLDLNIPIENKQAYKIYKKAKLMKKKGGKYDDEKYLCFMQKSIGIKEMKTCLKNASTDKGIASDTIRRLRSTSAGAHTNTSIKALLYFLVAAFYVF